MRLSLAASLIVLSSIFAGCFGLDSEDPTDPPLVGSWRAVLESPGGELPFTLEVTADAASGDLSAVVLNGREEVPFSGVEVDGRQVVLRLDWYDAEITARLKDRGQTLEGEWRKTIPDGDSRLPFRATLDDARRFLSVADAGEAPGAATLEGVQGAWSVEFTDEDGTEPARGEFQQEGERVLGTFLTPTGDYRYLAGSFEDGVLRLSTFDGAHAFLFEARAQEDGSLAGDFWSRDSYHATWTAQALEEEAPIPEAWSQVGLTNDEGRFTFSFPDLEGQVVSSSDPFFRGRVVLVNIFGSWCPNCNDEAPLLADWDRQHRDEGLAIVGLAYEFSGDPERDREMVRRFRDRYQIEYPLLLAGTSDKADAAATLPDLEAVLSYPTTVFIDRAGKVRRIHSGFAGPGTGRHYGELMADLNATLQELLAETAPFEVTETETPGGGTP
jgi:thiol-disulfide isomerase/thioredoxin